MIGVLFILVCDHGILSYLNFCDHLVFIARLVGVGTMGCVSRVLSRVLRISQYCLSYLYHHGLISVVPGDHMLYRYGVCALYLVYEDCVETPQLSRVVIGRVATGGVYLCQLTILTRG